MKLNIKDAALRGLSAVERAYDALHHRALKSSRHKRVQILCYAGYRTERRLYVSGRVVVGRRPVEQGQHRLSRLRTMLDMYDSDEVPGVALVVEKGGSHYDVETDDEGYFRLDVEIAEPLAEMTCWENATVSAASMATEEEEYDLPVLAPGTDRRLGVISDIDDTVMETGATSLLSKGWSGLFMSPQDRLAVPGAPELFQMLASGPGTPIFYVSSSSWNVYGFIDRFMQLKEIPPGPMFLKDFGLSDSQFFSSGHVKHKIDAIERILSWYPDFQFLLVGDNGQKDVETYRRVVRDHCDKVTGVFIRDVGGGCNEGTASDLLQEIRDKGIEVYCSERMDGARKVAAKIGFAGPT